MGGGWGGPNETTAKKVWASQNTTAFPMKPDKSATLYCKELTKTGHFSCRGNTNKYTRTITHENVQ